MGASWTRVAGVGLLVLLGTLPAAASAPLSPMIISWTRDFTVESQAAQARGRTVVQGTIRNTGNFTVRRVQLLVEGLDASGAVVNQRVEWLGGDLQPGAHAYFEVPASGPAASYRISVFAFDRARRA